MPQIQVLPYVPGFGEQLAQSLGQAAGNIGQGYIEGKQKANDQKILEQFASNPDLSPMEMIKSFGQLSKSGQQSLSPLINQLMQTQGQQKVAESKAATKLAEKQQPINAALETVGRQRELLKSGYLGAKTPRPGQILPKGLLSAATKKGQKARSEYERLGKSLISASSNIPIRNRQEFETLAESLYDPTLTEAQIEGNLDAMERILKNQLGTGNQQVAQQEQAPQKERKSLADLGF